MAVLFHCLLLQTDFEKDVDIACRSGKNIERVFSQQKIVLYEFLMKWKPEKILRVSWLLEIFLNLNKRNLKIYVTVWIHLFNFVTEAIN